MKKLFPLSILFVLVLSLVFAGSAAFAKQPDFDKNLPEQDGEYDVPGHANLKLRVFVHRTGPDRALASSLVCGLTDPDGTAQVAGAGWHLPSTWTYQLNPTSVPSSVGSANLAMIAANSFSAWTKEIPGKVTVAPGTDTIVNRAKYDGQNIITWGRTSGSALAVTYIWYDTSTHDAVELDTIMNQKFAWAWSNPATWSTDPGTTCAYISRYDAQEIMTHELGHWMGLKDHKTSEYENHTMYGYGSPTETKKDTLTTGDSAGVQALY